jgi:hypothetical protein
MDGDARGESADGSAQAHATQNKETTAPRRSGLVLSRSGRRCGLGAVEKDFFGSRRPTAALEIYGAEVAKAKRTDSGTRMITRCRGMARAGAGPEQPRPRGGSRKSRR